VNLEELKEALARGEDIGFAGGAGQRVNAWGGKSRPAGTRKVKSTSRVPRGTRTQVPAPVVRREETWGAKLAPWAILLFYVLLLVFSRV